jgi:hypothetical protein
MATRPNGKPAPNPAQKAKAPEKPARVAKVAFPKKAHPPSHAEFAARLPAAVGKKFESIRGFLGKQGATEGFYYYGPRTGWAYRYLHADKSLCSIVFQSARLIGILALDAAAQSRVVWDELSDVARRARRVAHGTPALLWLDVPLDAGGAADFKALLRAKLAGR